jgi:hypothetical protein
MPPAKAKPPKIIIDLEKLNTVNDEGCAACGRKFTLGETAVMACGAWGDGLKLIHENEAVYDGRSGNYVERKCFESRKG